VTLRSANLSAEDALGFAELLRDAENEGSTAPLASTTFPGLDWEGARLIALARDDLRSADGDKCIGYKLGWTSAAMREALGIERPNWGTLWESQRIDGRLNLTKLRHPKAEPEIVFSSGADLGGEGITANDVLASAAGWSVGIEVVHPRWASYDFTWLDNTADNSSAAAVTHGAANQLDNDPADIVATYSNGIETRKASGTQAMGSPAVAVAWLARQLATEGRSIERGHVVYTGGLTAPFDVQSGRRYTVQTAQLESVEFVADLIDHS